MNTTNGNIPCEVIRDLLPLYEDDVLSERSKCVVEEHLSVCEKCRELYHDMQEDLPEITTEEEEESSILADDIKFIKGVSRKITYRKLLAIGVALLLVLTVTFFAPNLTERITRIPSEKIHVTELYELKDGNIYFTIESDRKITQVSTSPIVVPEKYMDKDYDNGWGELRCYNSILHHLQAPGGLLTSNKASFVYPVRVEQKFYPDAVINEPGNLKTIIQNSKAIYYIDRSNKRVTIWEEGQKLEPAPDSIEKKVEAERKRVAPIEEEFAAPDGLIWMDYDEE